MKIKEAAQVCGLTEKAIRLYESKGLITPITEEKNGRTFREYSEENIRTLTTVGILRRAGFSLEQIGIMQSTPERIPEVFAGYREEVSENALRLAALCRAMEGMSLEGADDLDGFADRLALAMAPEEIPPALPGEVTQPIPPGEELPRRSQWMTWDEEIQLDEKEEAFRRFMEKYERKERIKELLLFLPRKLADWWKKLPRAIKLAVIIVPASLLTVYLVLNGLERVEPFSHTFAAVIYDRGNADPDQVLEQVEVTFDGNLHRFIWREDYYLGRIFIEGFTLNEKRYVGHSAGGFVTVEADSPMKIFYEKDTGMGYWVEDTQAVRTWFEREDGCRLNRYLSQFTGLEGEEDLTLIWFISRPNPETGGNYWSSNDGLYLVYPAITRDDAEFQVRKYWEQYSEHWSLEDPVK